MTSLATLPILNVSLGGSELSAGLLSTLAAVYVDESIGRPAQCELTFTDPPPADLDPGLLGGALSVVQADSGDEIFSGSVTALDVVHDAAGVTSYRVRGYADLNDAANSQTVRTFENMTVGEIVEEVLGDNGIFTEVQCDTSHRLHVTQYNESDLEFVTRLLDEEGVLLVSRGMEATVVAPEAGLPEIEFLELGLNLIEVAIEVNRHRATAAVAAEAWSPETGEPAEESATSSRVSHGLGAAAGAARTVSGILSSDARAAALAQAILDRRAAADSVVRGTAEGSATLRPGVVVALEGVAEAFAESYVVTHVRHAFDGRGFLTEFDSDVPAPGPVPSRPTATIGVVTSVDDPDAMGRIQVVFPSFGGVQSPWLLVALPGGSAAAGLTCLPSIDDTVLVLLADGSPSNGVVVGGIAPRPGLDDPGVDAGATSRYLLSTPGGHRITLDDTGQLIRFEDITGSSLEMSPEMVTLHSAVDLAIEAPGRAVSIAGNTIDFRRA